MKKKIVRVANLVIARGQAKPGASLSSWGINMPAFCKEFNAVTGKEDIGKKVSVRLTVFDDKSFSFEVKKPHVSDLWKEIIQNKAKKELTFEELNSVTSSKISDLNTEDFESAKKIILGSLKSANIKVVG